jgi:hypothetical protein
MSERRRCEFGVAKRASPNDPRGEARKGEGNQHEWHRDAVRSDAR